MSAAPRISFVTPVYDPPLEALTACLDSVGAQGIADWEHVLVDDCSTDPRVRELLRRRSAQDPRVKVVERATNGGIVAASQDALEAATGEFVAFLDHDDRLAPEALRVLAAPMADPEVDYIYTDEDKVDETGRRFDAFRKPTWSPERLRHQMYTGHLSVMRASLVREVGGIRTGFDGSQDHDLALRVTERARAVVHVPQVLYHWMTVQGSTAADPGAKPYAWEAGRRAVAEHLERVGIAGTAELGPVPGTYWVRRATPDVRVSVVIPTRGGAGMIWGERAVHVVEAVASVMATTTVPVEVVVVYDTVTEPSVLDALRDRCGDALVLVPYDEPFNFSRKCNVGVAAAQGDVIVLMNDDVRLTEPGSLDQLAAAALEDGVGAVSCRLLFEDGRLQHGGHVYEHGDWHHVLLGAGPQEHGPFAGLHVGREASGVTAALVAVRRDVYVEAGGMAEQLPVNFNDVDFCYKVRHLGYRILWLPEVTAYHFESQTRTPSVHAWEVSFVRHRWGVPVEDVYFPEGSHF
ncbi:glycosyltransferase [Cellulomonas sp. JZ18]|uniref:glycosyltransferase family 2 protein n=1 Tax=Cellulomonas sp. JZ18 TaxID=2654191 RepID=UPI0012D49D28|nr:glycosyltransferase [Cellulomonas sp. JZ18]QGQ18875.1 glycosyltransferase [Cellulomonas sp. JZ18]